MDNIDTAAVGYCDNAPIFRLAFVLFSLGRSVSVGGSEIRSTIETDPALSALRPIGSFPVDPILSLAWKREENEMAEPKGWKSWLPEPKAWKSWLPEPKGWKSWTSEPNDRRSRMGQNTLPNQGVVKRDWVATGRIDFATRLNSDAADADQPNEFKLLVEERRIVESIAGNENLEIQWRLATLKEAKAVVTQYHKYLSENSLIKTVVETDVSVAPGDFTSLEKQ
jgi:hypothetical protein